VQERGLYFWTEFDPKYTPLLAMNDPGEPDLNGGLVYTHYGKGTYIYTGLAFFRQLPEGVPGLTVFSSIYSGRRGAAEPVSAAKNLRAEVLNCDSLKQVNQWANRRRI